MKIVTIIGARPQFIKAAVVSRAIAEANASGADGKPLREIIIHTGQHYDDNMSEVFFREMQIPIPDYSLGIKSFMHGAMTGRMMEQIEDILIKESPDAVLVYGDTNSTLAGALASVKLHVPVAHVEAGLRSFNMRMPEEINRILTDRVSRWLFCPTDTAIENLRREGLQGDASPGEGQVVLKVGDVMYDAMLFYKKIASPSSAVRSLRKELEKGYYLATVHRQENTDDQSRLTGIMRALDEISQTTPVVLPLHPRTRKMLNKYGITLQEVNVLEPVGYFDMINLLEGCRAVFTDSGGLQKESYFTQKPCITLREETEWVELVESGSNIIAGCDSGKILDAERAIGKINHSFPNDLYGSGNAGDQILRALMGRQ